MGTTEQLIDPITVDLRQLISDFGVELQHDSDEIIQDIFSPITELSKKKISGKPAFLALSTCIKRAEKIMAQICSYHSIDFWFAYLRRLPAIRPNWPAAWTAYATLGILKWSNQDDTSLGSRRNDDRFDVVFEFTENDLFLCERLATVGMALHELNVYCRLVGKGSSIRCLPDGKVLADVPADVEKAVSMYEERRPELPIFADEGILVIPRPESFLEHPIFGLGKLSPAFAHVILNSTGEKIQINYLPHARSMLALQQALLPYDDALVDLFRLDTKKIIQTIEAFCRLLLISVPPSDETDKLAFNTEISDELFLHRLTFMVNFYRKGYIRFPLEHLQFSLLNSMMESGISIDDAKEAVDLFFKAFCLKDGDRNKIDVRSLRPSYILYESPGGQCYFDLLHLGDFIQWLIFKSRGWFSSQHGDRFTLALKTMIEKYVPHATIISWKQKYVGKSGRKEIDLLVKNGETLYVVECKAFTKSREYWYGDPDATRSRTGSINKAVNQAKAGAATIQPALNSKSIDFPDVNNVEWVVCCPTQEYINPWDKYGFLSNDIPRVCTPQEFVDHLNRDD
jgi:Nuclease-related domain.